MIVQANLSDVDDGRITPGMAVLCTLDAYPTVTYRGRVVEISPVARESQRSPLLRYFPVRIALETVGFPAHAPRHVGARRGAGAGEPETPCWCRGPPSTSRPADRGALLAAGGTAPVRLGPCSAEACVVESGVARGHPAAPSCG